MFTLTILSQPLMPFGVEHHNHNNPLQSTWILSQPLMPFGVDHNRTSLHVIGSCRLSQPLMPFGVEHFPDHGTSPSINVPVPTFDAFWR